MKPKNHILTAALLLSLPAQGAITYVDAVSGSGGNTFATGGSQNVTTWVAADATTAIDNQWRLRSNLGNGLTLFQAIPSTNATPPPIPELTTTLTLANDKYNIWVFFWEQVASTTQNWVISTGLTSGSLTTYSSPATSHTVAGTSTSGVANASTLTFSNPQPTITEANGDRNMFGVNLGQVDVTGGSLNVYVDMLIPGSSTTQRVWYDGVGYELIPEPSAALLGGLGLLALLRRRRN